ncbi:MAG TPA: hypothetical protein DCL49_05765 [Candidatus Omnitrophica bacterium]|nr:hypothetical protein [Candidatus Omnitrophota bacterium]
MNKIIRYVVFFVLYVAAASLLMVGCSSQEALLTKENRLIFSGIASINKGQIDKAERDFNEVLSFNSGSVMAYCGLGQVYIQKRGFDKALSYYTKALLIDEVNPQVHIGLGSAYFMKGDAEKAIESYEEAIRLDDKSAQAYFGLAIAYSGNPEYAEQISELVDKLDKLDKKLADKLRQMQNLNPGGI